MSKEREALKLALEALEEIKGWTDRWTSPGHPVSTFAEKAIKPLKAALAQPEQEAADPLQGAVNWLREAHGQYFCVATVQRTLCIGYNRAKRLCETAIEAANDIKE